MMVDVMVSGNYVIDFLIFGKTEKSRNPAGDTTINFFEAHDHFY